MLKLIIVLLLTVSCGAEDLLNQSDVKDSKVVETQRAPVSNEIPPVTFEEPQVELEQEEEEEEQVEEPWTSDPNDVYDAFTSYSFTGLEDEQGLDFEIVSVNNYRFESRGFGYEPDNVIKYMSAYEVVSQDVNGEVFTGYKFTGDNSEEYLFFYKDLDGDLRVDGYLQMGDSSYKTVMGLEVL